MSGKRFTSKRMERLRWIEILGEGMSPKRVGHLFRSGMRRMEREYQGEDHGAGMYLIYMAKWITSGYQPLYDFDVKKISFDINKLNVYSFSIGNTSTDTMAIN